MAQWKWTARMGDSKDKVTLGAGTAIAGSDAIEINVDVTNMTRREFAATMKLITARAIEAAYPAA